MTNPVVPSLLDTDVMLAVARAQLPAIRFFLAINRLGPPRFSRVTALAMLSDCPSDPDRALVLRYLATSRVEELTDVIARRAVDLLAAVALPTPLTPPDALVAATALELGLPLYTLDPARFAAVPGLTAVPPY